MASSQIRLQVVAFPGAVYRRLKSELAELQQVFLDHDIHLRFVQSRHDNLPELREGELNQIAANIQDGFVHIATLPSRNQRALQEFEFDCRVIRVDVDGYLNGLTLDSFRAAITVLLEFEERWCDVIRPQDWHSPLWLPPLSFDVREDLRNFWRRCDCYGNTELLGNAHDLLQTVRSLHRRSEAGQGAVWIDDRSKRFRVDRSLHGMTKEEREGKKRFRFATEVPTGFHYDVTHVDGKKFPLASIVGMHSNCIRANVNPWGHCVVKE